MSDFYSRDTELSILTNYLDLGSYAMCLHHSPDEHTGKELSKWYRVQVGTILEIGEHSSFYTK